MQATPVWVRYAQRMLPLGLPKTCWLPPCAVAVEGSEPGEGVWQCAEGSAWGAAVQPEMMGPATRELTANARPLACVVPRSTRPTTSPLFVINGPPLLPGLTGVSVC